MTNIFNNLNKCLKGASLSAALFYFLIAFEFFYMASPFAIYFYSLYKPSLTFLTKFPILMDLTQFFLPHVVMETSSWLLNVHTQVGVFIATLGFLGFVIGASQVYYYKLTKKGAVTGGIYNFIRHPQYTSLAVSSFGLLIVWPRFIALLFFFLQ